jgi:hypothetical protein
LAFWAFSIFLELIELNFCFCNYDLRKNIVQRSIIESKINNEFDDSLMSGEEEKNEEDTSICELSSK